MYVGDTYFMTCHKIGVPTKVTNPCIDSTKNSVSIGFYNMQNFKLRPFFNCVKELHVNDLYVQSSYLAPNQKFVEWELYLKSSIISLFSPKINTLETLKKRHTIFIILHTHITEAILRGVASTICIIRREISWLTFLLNQD